MQKNQNGTVWVIIVVILAIIAMVGFAWWSISHSKQKSAEILKPVQNSTDKEKPKN